MHLETIDSPDELGERRDREKLAVNTYVTTKISYANMLSEICERLPGADVEVVTAAVGDDRRIGHAYLRGTTAYGGPCFPRDNSALVRTAEMLGVGAPLATATEQINRRQAGRLSALVADHARAHDRIAILGMAYKPDTSVTEESAGLAVARELLDGDRGRLLRPRDSNPAMTSSCPRSRSPRASRSACDTRPSSSLRRHGQSSGV